MTDISITTKNIKELVKCGRARWKTENETFNTLKSQGHHAEHNYGNGKQNLAYNFRGFRDLICNNTGQKNL